MHVPIGQITVLMRGEDIQLCESCGRYLYLPDPAESEVPGSERAKPPRSRQPSRANAGRWRTPPERLRPGFEGQAEA